ncbi:hypothetical protein DYB35_008852 [Aphanomyces astaci]|uniref:Uncharacterized protein n=1 Tax=Aphanomyces astaci TaxID=112090 RepID=A0A418D6T8_APHAT|nr:hypothetical protein DYB35_008852 [Aphanomyces astaci]
MLDIVNGTPLTPIAYMDESCIHYHYKQCDDSLDDLNDLNDELDVQVKEAHKESRYCFIAGILDSSTLVFDGRISEMSISLDVARTS